MQAWFPEKVNEMLRPLESTLGNASGVTIVWSVSLNMTMNLTWAGGSLW